MRRGFTLLGLLGLVVILLFVFVVLGPAPFDFALNIVFGWVLYLMRVLPQVRLDPSGIATGVLCLILFAVGAHSFLVWLLSSKDSQELSEPPRDRIWKWQWTASLVVLVVMMFVAGMATTGVTHQVGWLITSKEAWTEGSGRSFAARMMSLNNLKQIGLGLHNFHEAKGTFPAGSTFTVWGEALHGWQTMLLPYVDRQDLYDRIDFSASWSDPANAPVFKTAVFPYLNPGTSMEKDSMGYVFSHYTGNARILGGNIARTKKDIKDGESSTILGGEVGEGFEPWGKPMNWRDPALGINRSPRGFGSPFKVGANILFADGSVRFIMNSVNPEVLKSLSTPSGGEKVSLDSY
jgi:prepilin-type processing-associated H-X9-DG protein